MEQKCLKGHLIFKERCPFCRALKREWDQFLESSGFVDIEKDQRNLDGKCSAQVALMDNYREKTLFDSRMNYYQWAREKLNTGKFKSESDKLIWECHAEGMPRRKIAPRIGLEHSWVTRKIHRIEKYLKNEVLSIASVSYAFG